MKSNLILGYDNRSVFTSACGDSGKRIVPLQSMQVVKGDQKGYSMPGV